MKFFTLKSILIFLQQNIDNVYSENNALLKICD
mgnify:CR=1 FL=1